TADQQSRSARLARRSRRAREGGGSDYPRHPPRPRAAPPFDIISRDEIHNDPTVRLLLTRALARASGIGGMVGGQMRDLAGEGRFGDREPVDVERLQQMKTGALLRFACVAGAILGQSSRQE